MKRKYSSLTLHCRKKHDYLGMDLDYSFPGGLTVNMTKYMHNIINNFPKELGAPHTTPAGDHLFKICKQNESKTLPEDQAIIFHHTVVQLLFLSS